MRQRNVILLSVGALIVLVASIAFLIYHADDNWENRTYLERYFRDIASSCKRLGFELLSQEEIDSMQLPTELGKAQFLIAPNSKEKFLVLGCLIPAKEYLYADLYTYDDNQEKMKFLNTYIEDDDKGTALLYTFLGNGAEDIIVAFFNGATKDIYENYAESIISDYCQREDFKRTTTTTYQHTSAPIQTITVNDVSFKMILVEGGTFTMGATEEQDSDADDDEKPSHKVTLSTYYIGETEVTQALWEAVMGSNPSSYKVALRPVETVSRYDCLKFIKKLNSITGMNFRLPTEAEWEFAARGGNKSQGYKYSGSNTLNDVAWYRENSDYETHNVMAKSPNELGIYDMSGNVLEWCQDRYGSYSSKARFNPKGASSGSVCVSRGGSWLDDANFCRVSSRNDYPHSTHQSHFGLRLAL